MGMISQQVKDRFLKSQKIAHEDYMEKIIVWKKRLGPKRNKNGEDTPDVFDDRQVNVLCNYNYMRTWPATEHMETGQIDRQSIQVFFSKILLKEKGWLNDKGNMDYDPGYDRFIINNIEYFARGDTPASQGFNDDLLFCITVGPEEPATKDKNR